MWDNVFTYCISFLQVPSASKFLGRVFVRIKRIDGFVLEKIEKLVKSQADWCHFRMDRTPFQKNQGANLKNQKATHDYSFFRITAYYFLVCDCLWFKLKTLTKIWHVLRVQYDFNSKELILFTNLALKFWSDFGPGS